MAPDNLCDQVRLELFSYLRGEHGPGQAGLIRRHIEVCASCSQERDEMEGILSTLSTSLEEIRSEESVWHRVKERIGQAREIQQAQSRTEVRIAAALITVFGALCLAWLLKINDQVVAAFNETLLSLGLAWPWLTEGPVSSFLAPLLFISLCAFLTLILSPFILMMEKRKALEEQGKDPLHEASQWEGA
ncbi:MAG: hypothetical protein ACYTG7_11035 [Planctomycetota bacterium]|jgi:energy-converting hydrogenase Eha subunit E